MTFISDSNANDYGILPSCKVVPFVQAFEDGGGSKDMDVDGDPTPVDFFVAPNGTDKWYCHGLGIFLQDSGSMDPQDFGAIGGGLTNGFLVTIQSNGQSVDVFNCENNIELYQLYSYEHVLQLDGSEGGAGFFDSIDTFAGLHRFPHPVLLDAAQGDFIRYRVRDDIDGLTFFRGHAHFWQVIL